MNKPCPVCGRGVYCVCKAKETITTHKPDCAYLDTIHPDPCDCWMDDEPPSIPEDYPAKREVDMIAAKQKAHEARMDPMTNPDPKPIEPSEERKRVDAFLAGLDDSDDWTRDLLAFRAQARAEERDAWVEANAGQMEEVRRQERERSLECPECGGNIGCLNGCTGDMTVQLRAALREAKIEVLREIAEHDLECIPGAVDAMIAKLESEGR